MATSDVPPDNMNEWMRWIENRLRSLDRHRHPIMTQNWLIREEDNGDLIAVHSSGTEVVIASP